MGTSQDDKIDYVTLTIHGRTQKENSAARQSFYDFVKKLEMLLGSNRPFFYLRKFKSFGQEINHCRFNMYGDMEDPLPSNTVIIYNGAYYNENSECFVGPPSIRLTHAVYRSFFEHFSKALFETIPSKYIYLSRIDLKFRSIKTTFRDESLNDSILQNSDKINQFIKSQTLEDLANTQQTYRFFQSSDGETHGFGRRDEDIYYGRLAIWRVKKEFAIYFELEIKNPNLKLDQSGILIDSGLEEEDYIFSKMLKNSLPFFYKNSLLLNPKLNLGSKLFKYYGLDPNSEPTTFFPSNRDLLENDLEPVYDPLWLGFGSSQGGLSLLVL